LVRELGRQIGQTDYARRIIGVERYPLEDADMASTASADRLQLQGTIPAAPLLDLLNLGIVVEDGQSSVEAL